MPEEPDRKQFDHAMLLDRILSGVRDLLLAKGLDPPLLGPTTILVKGDTGIDSLDLAALLVELELFCDVDPFADGFKDFRTAAELANLYVAATGR
ncbi:hypothetical protein [Bradyrhizobium prioriisuperbiae]|uniref:hypothetical protein n=1 Tax=Bradyrhizobium prioriisuperbiae TaxID=2854389 RepID=UPI0028F0BB20|nr:hypothetical protein [Bradyrhizobium prioritasuperba]